MVTCNYCFISSINKYSYNTRKVDLKTNKLLPLIYYRMPNRYQDHMENTKLNVQNQKFVKDNKFKNVKTYADYIKKRRFNYKEKSDGFNNNFKYNRTKESDN